MKKSVVFGVPVGLMAVLCLGYLFFRGAEVKRYFNGAVCASNQCVIYDAPLTAEWSEKLTILTGYNIDTQVYDQNAVVEIRVNGEDQWIYTQDAKNISRMGDREFTSFVQIGVYYPSYIQVRAVPGSEGKRVVVSLVAPKKQ